MWRDLSAADFGARWFSVVMYLTRGKRPVTERCHASVYRCDQARQPLRPPSAWDMCRQSLVAGWSEAWRPMLEAARCNRFFRPGWRTVAGRRQENIHGPYFFRGRAGRGEMSVSTCLFAMAGMPNTRAIHFDKYCTTGDAVSCPADGHSEHPVDS